MDWSAPYSPRQVVVLPSFMRVAAMKMRLVTVLFGLLWRGSAGRENGFGEPGSDTIEASRFKADSVGVFTAGGMVRSRLETFLV
jgi:hypothetical protein